MGGFGSGGSRPGSGRKKKPKHLRVLDGGADRRGGGDAGDHVDAAAVVDPATIEPPATLSAAELDVWQAWAPLAHAAGTLTKATLPNFVLLCKAERDRRQLEGSYQPQRSLEGELLPLLVMGSKEELAIRREHRTLLKDIHARMKDFMIAPFGKELAPSGGAGEQHDPLDAFMRRG